MLTLSFLCVFSNGPCSSHKACGGARTNGCGGLQSEQPAPPTAAFIFAHDCRRPQRPDQALEGVPDDSGQYNLRRQSKLL